MTYDPAVTIALDAIDAALASLESSTTSALSLAGLAAIRTAVQTVAAEPEDGGTPPPPPPPPDDPPEQGEWSIKAAVMARMRCATSAVPAFTVTYTSAKAGAVATH